MWFVRESFLEFCIFLKFNPTSQPTKLRPHECTHFHESTKIGHTKINDFTVLEIHSFPHFSFTCFEMLSWNFAYDFVLLYYRSRSSVINLRQFLWELCLFVNLEYWKYTVFRTFLLHPLTYWAEKFAYYFVFLYYRSSLSVVNLRLFWSYASFRT